MDAFSASTRPCPVRSGAFTPQGPSPGARDFLKRPRGPMSPHAGEGRGFDPSVTPRSLLPAPDGGYPHRPFSLPGRSRDGSIPFGMRRGPPRAHFPPGPSRLDPEGFRPVAALGETVRRLSSVVIRLA